MKRTIILLLLALGGLVCSFGQNGSATNLDEQTHYHNIGCEVGSQPNFPGGMNALFEYLSKNISYPPSAKKAGIEGKVIVGFVVGKDGRVTDVQALRSLDPACDEEAVRLIKSMPAWSPGKQGNKVVRVRMTLPIVFKLDN